MRVNNAFLILLYSFVASLFIIFNPQSLNYHYGDGGGKYEDRVDSSSDYLIRNTVKANILTEGSYHIFPIRTIGYSDGNYDFNPNGMTSYTSNISFQTLPLTFFANVFGFKNESELDDYFSLFRIVTAVLFSILVTLLYFCFCYDASYKTHFLIPFLVGGSAGFVFFAQNLYFLPILMVFPPVLMVFQLVFFGNKSKFWVFVLSVIFFCRGYEFATVYSLLMAFLAFYFTRGDIRYKLSQGALVFGITCVSFVFSIFIHISLLSFDSGWELSFFDSLRTAFGSLTHRTLSVNGVVMPFTDAFYQTMWGRLSKVAFSWCDGFPNIKELYVIVFLFLSILISSFSHRNLLNNITIIAAYGIVSYLSWYVFAYQHIMWHGMYDWYIFSLTLGLSFGFISLILLNDFYGYVKRRKFLFSWL
ncbi:hypothetical protein VIBRN418_14213 [Vibrio sp. N418]|uniref:hypothetical protein n=1 Tax=Vibrio sp. (strain N418) TaxID=701176 RepID=UPI00021BE2CC|nr:hypothetical protein [Vibrio sp. N418]EGU32217.1 hypothetical protein VIBRN418_14213 [Vibrio sp. N418]